MTAEEDRVARRVERRRLRRVVDAQATLYLTATGVSVRHAVDIAAGARRLDEDHVVEGDGPRWEPMCGRSGPGLALDVDDEGRLVPWPPSPGWPRECADCPAEIYRREERRRVALAEIDADET